MDIFGTAKVVRLRSHCGTYLIAKDDDTVVHGEFGAATVQAKWTVEFVVGHSDMIRLKSCYGLYLAASKKRFILGLTGRKVVQNLSERLDPSIEWEPLADGDHVKLRTWSGRYLRFNNAGMAPYKNSVTHDVPKTTVTQDWVLWQVEVIEPKGNVVQHVHDDSRSLTSPPESDEEEDPSPLPSRRTIFYDIANDDGHVNSNEGSSFIIFEGTSLLELTHRLEEETEIDGLILCTRNLWNRKLYRMTVDLPATDVDKHVVVVPPNSKVQVISRSS